VVLFIRSLILSNVLPVRIASISAIPAKYHRDKKRGVRILNDDVYDSMNSGLSDVSSVVANTCTRNGC
jgi:hypothetical protein